MIKKYIEKYQNDPSCDIFICKLINVDEDDNNSFISSFYQVRIFRNNIGLYYKGKVHESIKSKYNKNLQMTILPSNISIYHTGYSTKQQQKKAKRNLYLLTETIKQTGEKPEFYAYLADCYLILGNYDKSIYYSNALINSKIRMLGGENGIYNTLIIAMQKAGRPPKEIIQTINKAIEEFPSCAEYYFRKSVLLFEQCLFVDSEKALAKVFSLNSTKGASENTMLSLSCKAYGITGKIAALKNDLPKAITCYTNSLLEYKYSYDIFEKFYQLIRMRPLNLRKKVLAKIYTDTKKDIKFIVNALAAIELGELYLYYRKKLVSYSKIIDNETVELTFATENYIKTAAKSKKQLDALYKKIMMSFLNQKEQIPDNIKVILPQKYQVAYKKTLEKLTKQNK